MAPTQKTADELLREMSDNLGLGHEPQDWGIINADGDRLDEFVTFFQREELLPTQRFELADLILASANERLLEGLDVEIELLKTLAREYDRAFTPHIEYWSGLEDEDEFPLSRLLRRTKGSSRASR
ncbi:hypothetical protein G6O69_07460 [Pseudenhygromyxa sp. WMMC2535]|uniref:hypothetical protein n=1 Tax=Pseudenhygromyxa sp. WMMC2535 TaxID=2712867 RepID=UPI0015550B6E|nr:hypothetical protein [Pseudenhygromyxa sp. WMMC2535]NVB37665.1 hypothetical protein [Pseudenhygromyxa sp. WMMC2535]